jgi:hypothetical protein
MTHRGMLALATGALKPPTGTLCPPTEPGTRIATQPAGTLADPTLTCEVVVRMSTHRLGALLLPRISPLPVLTRVQPFGELRGPTATCAPGVSTTTQWGALDVCVGAASSPVKAIMPAAPPDAASTAPAASTRAVL